MVTKVSAARDPVGVAGGGTGPELPLGGSDGASDPNKHQSKSPESGVVTGLYKVCRKSPSVPSSSMIIIIIKIIYYYHRLTSTSIQFYHHQIYTMSSSNFVEAICGVVVVVCRLWLSFVCVSSSWSVVCGCRSSVCRRRTVILRRPSVGRHHRRHPSCECEPWSLSEVNTELRELNSVNSTSASPLNSTVYCLPVTPSLVRAFPPSFPSTPPPPLFSSPLSSSSISVFFASFSPLLSSPVLLHS